MTQSESELTLLDLPLELLLAIVVVLPVPSALNFLSTCKSMARFLETDELWIDLCKAHFDESPAVGISARDAFINMWTFPEFSSFGNWKFIRGTQYLFIMNDQNPIGVSLALTNDFSGDVIVRCRSHTTTTGSNQIISRTDGTWAKECDVQFPTEMHDVDTEPEKFNKLQFGGFRFRVRPDGSDPILHVEHAGRVLSFALRATSNGWLWVQQTAEKLQCQMWSTTSFNEPPRFRWMRIEEKSS